jgi:hypothetical protein
MIGVSCTRTSEARAWPGSPRLPGATATELWSIAGKPGDHLPSEIAMPAGAMVDAALAGLTARHRPLGCL